MLASSNKVLAVTKATRTLVAVASLTVQPLALTARAQEVSIEAIFDWHFVDGGRRVVLSHQPVHFSCEVLWELRDVASERTLAEARIPESCGQIPDPPKVDAPQWLTGAVSGFK